MTKDQKERLTWLEYQSQVTGKSIDEIRAEMSRRSKLANPRSRGFAVMSKEKLAEVHRKAAEARQPNANSSS